MVTSDQFAGWPEHIARPTQRQMQALEEIAKHRFTCLWGGSRSGKTWIICRALMLRAIKAPGSRHMIARHRFNAARRSVGLDTLPKVAQQCYPDVPVRMDKTDWIMRVETDPVSEIWIGGLDDKERTEKILGQEFATVALNECSQIAYDAVQMTLSRLAQNCDVDEQFGGGKLPLRFLCDLNPTSKKHWTHRLFVDHVDPVSGLKLPDPSQYGGLLMNPTDNLDNLPAEYIQMLESMPMRQRNRFLLGLFADEVEGAMFRRDWFTHVEPDDCEPEGFDRIVVAIDPSGGGKDETGIVAAGMSRGDYCVLEDVSGKMSAEEWARRAIDVFDRWQASTIIGEKNFAGDMVEAVVRNAAIAMHSEGRRDSSVVPYQAVTASRGKVLRAEPVAALYEQGKVWHRGELEILEDQLASFTYEWDRARDGSPDRLDACVFALTELSQGRNTGASVGFGHSDVMHRTVRRDKSIPDLLRAAGHETTYR